MLLLTGCAIVLAVLVVALGLVGQIFVVNTYYVAGGAVHTTAPLGATLAVAHVSSLVLAMTVPLAIGLSGYWLAGRWLAASYDGGIDRPTPYQLGVLMNTLSGANLTALWTGSIYVLGLGHAPGGKSLSQPPILRHGVLMLFLFLALAYCSSAIETWMGARSDGMLFPVATTTTHSGVPLPVLGRRVNQTLCDETRDATNNQPYQCGIVRGSGGNPHAHSQRILMMNGLSDTVIAFTDDSTAIMVPPAAGLSATLGYTAKTMGVKSSCTSVTSQCIDLAHTGPNAGLNTTCPASVNFNTTEALNCNDNSGTMVGGPLSADGAILPCGKTVDSTKFRFGIKVSSAAYNVEDVGSDTFVGETGFFLHGNSGGFNVLTCTVESLVVTYKYSNSSYALLTSTPSDLAQAQRVADGSRAAPIYVPIAIDGTGLRSGSYADAFAARLSLVALSGTAYVIEPAAALETQAIQPTIGARVPLAPLVLFFLNATAYCALVVFVTSKAVREVRASPYTFFARDRLVDPATAISSAYGPDDSKLRRMRTVRELFGEETSADRLNVAVDDELDDLPVVRRSSLARRRPGLGP